jgi:hypothetical protein
MQFRGVKLKCLALKSTPDMQKKIANTKNQPWLKKNQSCMCKKTYPQAKRKSVLKEKKKSASNDQEKSANEEQKSSFKVKKKGERKEN